MVEKLVASFLPAFMNTAEKMIAKQGGKFVAGAKVRSRNRGFGNIDL